MNLLIKTIIFLLFAIVCSQLLLSSSSSLLVKADDNNDSKTTNVGLAPGFTAENEEALSKSKESFEFQAEVSYHHLYHKIFIIIFINYYKLIIIKG